VAKQPKVKRLYLGFGDAYVPPAISCAYPLDASSAELITDGFLGKLAMNGDEQTGTLALDSGYQVYGMSVSGIEAGASIPFNSGAVAVETQFTLPTITGTTGNLQAGISFYESGVSPLSVSEFDISLFADAAGSISQTVTINNSLVYSGVPSSGSVRCGIRVDTGVLRVWFDGIEASLASSALPDVAMIPVSFIQKADGLDAADTGKTASIQLITNATSMTSPFPMGTTDPCGNSAA